MGLRDVIDDLSPRWNTATGRRLLALSALFFGAMAVATRAVSSELGAAQIVTVRFILGLVGVAAVTAVNRKMFVATRPWLLLLRGLLGGGAVLGYFIAIERLDTGMGTLLNYTFPLWAALFAAFFLKERIDSRLAAGFILAIVGLLTAVGPSEIAGIFGDAADPQVRFGLIAGVLSSVLAGAAVVTVRALRSTDSSVAVFGAFCGFGLLVVLPGAIADWRPVSLRAALLLVAIGVFSFAAQFLFTFALRFVTAGTGSLSAQLTVVASYGIAALALGEPLSMRAALGSLAVMAGVVVTSVSSSPDLASTGPSDSAADSSTVRVG